MAIPAEVVVIMDRTGTKGIYRIRAKLLGDVGRNKVVVRNVQKVKHKNFHQDQHRSHQHHDPLM